MGSRITRAIFKDQRKQQIKKQRQEDIKVLIVCFLGSINTIYFFLFGYLFRPYIRSPDSVALFFAIMVLFLFLQLKQINKATLITSVSLFLAIILTKFLGIELTLLKALLILLTTTLSAVSSFQIGSSPFLQALFLWLAYGSFGLGVKMSLAVSKIKLENENVEAVGKGESMLTQVVFSLIGIMSIILLSVGKSILKLRPNDSQKQTAFGKQILYASMNFLLMVFSFGFKSTLQNSFLVEVVALFSTLIILLLCKKYSFLGKIWILVFCLAILTYFIDYLTQNEAQIVQMVNSIKMVMIDFIVIDCVQKWINWSSTGTDRPILTVFIYFSAFYLSQYSNLGVKILSYFTPFYMEIILMGFYFLLQVVHRFDRPISQSYEEVVV